MGLQRNDACGAQPLPRPPPLNGEGGTTLFSPPSLLGKGARGLGATGLTLELIQVREVAREHGLAVAPEPVVQQRGVDLAEVDVPLQVAAVEVLQARVVADQ